MPLGLEEDIETCKTIAFNKGWHGVWNPASKTQKADDGNPGRSGGVAVFVWKGRTIMNSSMEADHRLVGAIIGWGRRESIHIVSIYGHDTGQHHHEEGNDVLRGSVGRHLAAIGRVHWVVGGGCNLQPGECTIEGASCIAVYVEPGAPTCITGSTIDWFFVCAGLANGAESKVEGDAAVDKHKPVRLRIGGKL
eukprot:10745504-Heterocapsa_arctica.AAC.1